MEAKTNSAKSGKTEFILSSKIMRTETSFSVSPPGLKYSLADSKVNQDRNRVHTAIAPAGLWSMVCGP